MPRLTKAKISSRNRRMSFGPTPILFWRCALVSPSLPRALRPSARREPGAQRKMIVRAPSCSTRRSANHFTAWLRVRLSSSWPMATSSAGGAGVVDAHDVLLDDRPLVEVARDEVRRRADELHAAGVRLLVRVRALEAGQERVVDVDRPALEPLAQLGREDLHVAGQHDELDVVLLDGLAARGASKAALLAASVTGSDSNGTP